MPLVQSDYSFLALRGGSPYQVLTELWTGKVMIDDD
jgi:hypothetical protein